jgi:hypothetical protein
MNAVADIPDRLPRQRIAGVSDPPDEEDAIADGYRRARA